jgi:1-phosphofructokinase
MEAVDHRGAGDSMTAALAVAAARGLDPESGLRLAAAAGALNVTRHGLGSGRADAIGQLTANVEVRPLGVRAQP